MSSEQLITLKDGALGLLGLTRRFGAYHGSGKDMVSMLTHSDIAGSPAQGNILNSLVEYTLEIPLRERGALEVLHRLDLLGDLDSLLV